MAMPILILRLFLSYALLLGYGVLQLEASHQIYPELQNFEPSKEAFNSNQPYRTGYHFQPAKNWMNDPNGPMIYKGIYHLFYQYNPKGSVWGNIVWAHSTSTDLVNWTPQEFAISPSQPSDINGTWSGSATFLPDGTPVIIYTGVNPKEEEVQNLAMPKNSSDPYLREWVKSSKNPVITPTSHVNASAFRDPTSAWLGVDGTWRVIVGSKYYTTGLAALYRSKDLIHWTEASLPLHSARGTGMWECPDFYPVSVHDRVGVDLSNVGPNVKYVLKLSLDDTKHDYYTIGDYNQMRDIYTPMNGSVEGDSGLRLDHGKYYASKTFFDSSKTRRILWGWHSESSRPEDNVGKGWAGIQSVPRVVWLDKSGKQLVQWPIEEIEMLRTNPINLPSQVLNGGSLLEVSGVTAAQADVEISFKISNVDKAEVLDPKWTNPQLLCNQKNASVQGSLGPIGLLVLASESLTEHTSIFFRIFKSQNKYVVLMCTDQSRSSLYPGNDKTPYGAFVDVNPVYEELSLRSLIDHSVVESFGGQGKSCISARVYPVLANNEEAHLFAFNNGTESVTITRLSAWSMKKAQIN